MEKGGRNKGRRLNSAGTETYTDFLVLPGVLSKTLDLFGIGHVEGFPLQPLYELLF